MGDLCNFLMFWSIYCKKNNKDWHRWATGVFWGGQTPLRLKIWVDRPLENFRAGYPLETPSRGSRGSAGGKLTPPLPKKVVNFYIYGPIYCILI